MKLRDQRGVSLIELLVAIAVFAVLVLVIDAVFISAHRGARKAELGADVNQNARIGVERLTTEIRESSASLITPGAPDADGDYTAVVFRSARPSDEGSAFCLHWVSSTEPLAMANPGCTGATNGSYTPNWQRWIGYYFASGEVRRITSTSALDADGLSGACATITPPDTCQVIATFVRDFTVAKIESTPATVTVKLEGMGQEVVQGSNVPPQEIVLNVTTVIRN